MQDEDSVRALEIINELKRRRHQLELRAARGGNDTPPEVTLEIEDISKLIIERQSQLYDNYTVNPLIVNAWWRRKESLYYEVLNALATMLYYFDRGSDHDLGIRYISNDDLSELRKESEKAQKFIEKLTYTGMYILKPKVVVQLQELINNIKQAPENEEDYLPFMEGSWMNLIQCIDSVTFDIFEDLHGRKLVKDEQQEVDNDTD